MTVDLNTPISYFAYAFNTVLGWLTSVEWVIGAIHFNLFDLMLSIIIFDLVVWFIRMLLWANGE